MKCLFESCGQGVGVPTHVPGLIFFALEEKGLSKGLSPTESLGALVPIEERLDLRNPGFRTSESQRPGLRLIVDSVLGRLLVAVAELGGLHTKSRGAGGLLVWSPCEGFRCHTAPQRKEAPPR